VRIERALYQLLKNDADLTTAVGGRIFAGTIPRSTTASTQIYPLVVYAPTRAGHDVTRIVSGGCPLVEQPVEIFSASRLSYDEAADLDDRIVHLLDEFSGTVTDPALNESLEIQAVFSTNYAHVYSYLETIQVHQFLTEFQFHYLDPLRVNTF
jgi:hypothetical protein